MHPIERMRYVARAGRGDPADLVAEAAGAMAGFGDEPAGLVTACRRMVERQPEVGPIWWLASRMLCAAEPVAEGRRCVGQIRGDPTAGVLAATLPDEARVLLVGWPDLVGDALTRRADLHALVVDVDGSGSGLARELAGHGVDAEDVIETSLGAAAAAADVTLIEPSVIGSAGALAPAGSLAAAAVTRHAGGQVWLVAGVGRTLPDRIAAAATGSVVDAEAPWGSLFDVVPLDLAHRVVGPTGAVSVADALALVDCPLAPELLPR